MIRIEPGAGACIVYASPAGDETTGETGGELLGGQRSPAIVLMKPDTTPGSQLAIGHPEWARLAGAGKTSPGNPLPVEASAGAAAQTASPGHPRLPEGLAWLESISNALKGGDEALNGTRGGAVHSGMAPGNAQKHATQAAALPTQPQKGIDIPEPLNVKVVQSFSEPSRQDSASALLSAPAVSTEKFMDMGFSSDSGTSDPGSEAFQTYAGVQGLDGGKSANTVSVGQVRSTESAAIVEQIREPLVQAIQKGADHIQIRLKPEGMGEIHIDIRMKDGVNLRIITGTETTKQLLQAGITDLRNHLENRGIQLGEAHVSHREDQQGSPYRHGQDQESGRRPKHRSDNPFSEYLG